jgi:hypothetical protein
MSVGSGSTEFLGELVFPTHPPRVHHVEMQSRLVNSTALHIVQPAPIMNPTKTKSDPKTISPEESRRIEAKRILLLGEDGLDEFTTRDFTIHRVIR